MPRQDLLGPVVIVIEPDDSGLTTERATKAPKLICFRQATDIALITRAKIWDLIKTGPLVTFEVNGELYITWSSFRSWAEID